MVIDRSTFCAAKGSVYCLEDSDSFSLLEVSALGGWVRGTVTSDAQLTRGDRLGDEEDLEEYVGGGTSDWNGSDNAGFLSSRSCCGLERAGSGCLFRILGAFPIP